MNDKNLTDLTMLSTMENLHTINIALLAELTVERRKYKELIHVAEKAWKKLKWSGVGYELGAILNVYAEYERRKEQRCLEQKLLRE